MRCLVCFESLYYGSVCFTLSQYFVFHVWCSKVLKWSSGAAILVVVVVLLLSIPFFIFVTLSMTKTRSSIVGLWGVLTSVNYMKPRCAGSYMEQAGVCACVRVSVWVRATHQDSFPMSRPPGGQVQATPMHTLKHNTTIPCMTK